MRGGGPPARPAAVLIERDGAVRVLPNLVGEQTLEAGERLISLTSGGGGYGDPRVRDPHAVLRDVVEGYISLGRARGVYRVAIDGNPTKPENPRPRRTRHRRPPQPVCLLSPICPQPRLTRPVKRETRRRS